MVYFWLPCGTTVKPSLCYREIASLKPGDATAIYRTKLTCALMREVWLTLSLSLLSCSDTCLVMHAKGAECCVTI